MPLVVAGVVLGVLSRIEETEPFFLGISTHATWVLAPFAAGALSRRVASGAALLTIANAAYFAWIAATEDGPLVAVTHWFAAGLAAGLVFGAAGVWARGGGRIAAPALVAAVLLADAAGAFDAVLP